MERASETNNAQDEYNLLVTLERDLNKSKDIAFGKGMSRKVCQVSLKSTIDSSVPILCLFVSMRPTQGIYLQAIQDFDLFL